ncbi:MAG: hypothetical protein MK086_10535, partial [Flavobacteriales bacterium]|nr:hypothetical protein [Flavobacteriales bacterium]
MLPKDYARGTNASFRKYFRIAFGGYSSFVPIAILLFSGVLTARTPCQITCASDFTVVADVGLCSAQLTIPAPNTSGDCAGNPIFYSRDHFEATGGTISTYSEGGVLYRVHTFTNSGTFNLPTDQEIEYLVVGGGGAGRSGFNGGGGGAGGVQTGNMILSSQAYTITVGNGGVGSTENGGNGESSSINGIITAGGGFGATDSNGAGAASGSSQSNSGGQGVGFYAGGGGGAGGTGINGSDPTGGDGGSGVQSDITGINVWYAGGGGGASRQNVFGRSGGV